MASTLGIDPALTKLYVHIKLPRQVGETLKRENGICSVKDLVEQRLALNELVTKNASYDAARLLAVVDYIIERRTFHHNVDIDSLLGPKKNRAGCFAYFLARDTITKGLYMKTKPSKEAKAVERRPPCRKGWVVDKDKEDWKRDVPAVSDSEEPDENTLRRELDIGNDSPWNLDESLQYVVLKKLPEEMRVPVPLFRYLYAHQRSGVEWMAGLRIKKTGGILGDEMGMVSKTNYLGV